MIGIIGVILVGLGVAWLVAQNWHQIPAVAKIIILIVVTAAAYVAGIELKIHHYSVSAASLLLLGSLLYTSSVFLIAQIFSTSTTPQGVAWLGLLCWLGVLLAAYIFESKLSLILAFIQILQWMGVQFVAFASNARDMFTPAILAYTVLLAGVLWYGLSLWHRSRDHPFSGVYEFWSALYFLLFAYILSFQSLLPFLWHSETAMSTGPVIFLVAIGVAALITLVSGIFAAAHTVDSKEMHGVLSVIVVLALVLSLAWFVRDGNFFMSYGEMGLGMWAIWILANITLIGTILATVGYGTAEGKNSIINLAIAFFALFVITRYVGFVINLSGYLGLSVVFIIGGIILILGGIFIEKWRRTLVI